MDTQYIWHQPKVDPFDDAEFYEPGAIVTVIVGGRSITVDRDGEAEILNTITKVRIRTPEEFRQAFPDGVTPEDREPIVWVNNAWFDLYDGKGNHLEDDDHVAFSLAEALNDAEGCLSGELAW